MRTRAVALPIPVLALGFLLAACTSNDSPSTTDSKTSSGGSSSSSSGSQTPATGEKPKPPNTGPVDNTPPLDDSLDILVDPNAPACTGNAGEIYALTAPKLVTNAPIPLCRGKGRVMLIVNGASHCGYTPQYKPLQELYAKHKAAGLSILAFPSTSFNQEDVDAATVSDFCTKENGITFPLFAIDVVSDGKPKPGDVAQPVYKWLYAQPGQSTPVAWNFEKFLISKDGKVVKRWLSAVSPDLNGEIDLAIQAELAK